MRRTSGKVIDIRTGHAIAVTSSITHAFIAHVMVLVEREEPFYLVHGRCRHLDVRVMINDLKSALEDVQIIYDARMPTDTMWAFAGDPAELGFAV